MTPQYFDGEYLTDDAILTAELLQKCTINTTAQRPIPKTLNMKDSDQFDYHTKNLKVVYPGTGGSTTMIIPGAVIHHETFDHFGKTGVYVGVPQAWVDRLRTKLLSSKHRPVFEDTALASDEKYWWTRFGSNPAEEEKEFIFVVEEDENGGILENPYASFPELFNDVGSSVVANITCAMKMTAKTNVERKGAVTAEDEWRMGLNITRVNVTDLIDIDKPRNSITQRSLAGAKDKASSKLLARLREKRQNGV